MQKLRLLASGFFTALFLFAVSSPAQTISIISGNGQLVCPICPGAPGVYTPLVVQVNDASGKPVPNTTVTWTATQLGLPTTTATSTTNSSGQATYIFQPQTFSVFSSFVPATIVASALGASATFSETTATPSNGAAPLTISLIPFGPPPVLTGAVGTTAPTPIKVSVLGVGPLQGVAVTLKPGANDTATVTCATGAGQQPGTVLTDATGVATCTPVFGGKIGSGSYTIVVGGNFESFQPTNFTVVAGQPAAIKYISGNNQTVNPGISTPLALTAEVTDVGGNASTGAKVTWTVTSGTATITNPITTSPSTGIVTARVTPTSGPGPVMVTVALTSNPAVSFVFTVNVNTVITSLQQVSAATELAKVGEPFPDPLIVQANDNNLAVPGVTVNFAATGVPVTLSAPSALTNAQGQAQITATAGDTSGTATVTASITSNGHTYTQTFTLTVNPNGALITTIKNAAGFQDQFVSPCSLATVFGTGLATGIQGVVAAFIEPQTQVANVSVKFNGVSAPILDVANVNGEESMSVQIPCELQSLTLPATVPMVVTVDGVDSQPFDVTVSTYSPGIFQTVMSDGVMRAVLVRPDGSFVSLENPARRGEVIRMYVTGLGPTNPPLFTNEFDPLVPNADNVLVPQIISAEANIVVGVNNAGVDVISANYAYGMVGVFEVQFKVPADTATGNDAPFAIAIYQGTDLLFGNGSKIPIL